MRERQIDPIGKGQRVRIGRVLCEEGRGALEGGSQRWCIVHVADGKDWQQREQAERDKQADKVGGKQRHPSGGVRGLAVRDEQRKDGDGDGRDRYPEPRALMAKCFHWVSCWAKYIKGANFLWKTAYIDGGGAGRRPQNSIP